MHILKREVVAPKISGRDLYLLVVLKTLAVLGALTLTLGVMNAYARERTTSGEPIACGISAPLDCAVSIAGAFTDARIEASAAVEIAPTRIVVCKDAERDYDACLADEACGTETLGGLAQDLLICMPPARP